jgi:hypothetical protein
MKDPKYSVTNFINKHISNFSPLAAVIKTQNNELPKIQNKYRQVDIYNKPDIPNKSDMLGNIVLVLGLGSIVTIYIVADNYDKKYLISDQAFLNAYREYDACKKTGTPCKYVLTGHGTGDK